MNNRISPKFRKLLILVCMMTAATLASLAIAQSKSAFNLNSPASFPVDI